MLNVKMLCYKSRLFGLRLSGVANDVVSSCFLVFVKNCLLLRVCIRCYVPMSII
jgi:hypothetical protein